MGIAGGRYRHLRVARLGYGDDLSRGATTIGAVRLGERNRADDGPRHRLTEQDIVAGKGGFQKADLMDYGSLYGTGSYYGEDPFPSDSVGHDYSRNWDYKKIFRVVERPNATSEA